MAMTILNDSSRTKSLGQLNKNINAMGKVLAQSASGMKINGASDDASGFSISEKMRTQLRSLEQDIQNVRTGKSLINTAAGGIDEILQELRNLKALAIDAANDHNSDLDRATLQKEFDQRMENIDDIASTTNYNGKLLLNGDYERYRKQWEKDDDRIPPDSPEPLDIVEPNDPPTLIDSGPYTIRTAGVYVLGPNFTGTIDIEDNLVGVKIKQASAEPLTNVFINGPSSGKANLWIEGLNVKNTTNDSWIRFSGSDNVLSFKGNNTFTCGLRCEKATINIGGGLTIQSTGVVEFNEYYNDGAIIGTDSNENSDANLTIHSGTYKLTAANSRIDTRLPGGGNAALIGGGGNGKIGNITINGGSFDIFHPGGGAAIGAGQGGTAGNIVIKNAVVIAATDDGAGIGSGYGNSTVGDILIENSNIDVVSKKLTSNGGDTVTNNGGGAGIGGGGSNSKAGNITIRNSSVHAVSNYGAGIGSGYFGEAGNIDIEDGEKIFAESSRGENIGKGEYGKIGNITIRKGNDNDNNDDDVSYQELVLGIPLVIHNGTRANQALHCFIPNMHTKNMGLENISITTQQSAQHLLGDPHNPDEPGILDKAIDYALDAATGMGSYITELNYSEDNLVTNSENTQASESTIRDADMARTALDYAKSNILTQASQSMLAQANQNSSSVLTLLQA